MSRLILKKVIKRILGIEQVRRLLLVTLSPVSFLIIILYKTFDHEWYKAQYVGARWHVRPKPIAVMHYILRGRMMGLTPSPFFTPEYFDPYRWSKSIIDPLVRYLIRKNDWANPTSILFDGSFKEESKNWLPPLTKFLNKLKNDSQLPYDIKVENVSSLPTWQEAHSHIYKELIIRREQEIMRNTSRPVSKFDFAQEHKFIAKYRNKKIENKTNNPLVSIITPVWNRESMIINAIESAKNQTFSDWEMLVIDDGSTDKTRKIVEGYHKNDSRIKLIKQNHLGVCKARNAGLKLAKSRWIAFLDSDNTWNKDFLKTMVGFIQDRKVDAVYSAIKMESKGRVKYRITPPNPKLLEIGNHIDLNAFIVKKSTIENIGYFDEDLRRMVDYDLICRINKVAKFEYVPIIGVNYTDRDDLQRITNTELVSWDGVVKNNNFIDWDKAHNNRKKNTTSIIVPVRNDIRSAVRCIKSILLNTESDAYSEIIILDSSSFSAMNTTLSVFSLLNDRIRYIRQPASYDNTLGANYGFKESIGERLVFIDQRVLIEPNWLDALITPLNNKSKAITAPVQLRHNRSILSAGVIFEGRSRNIPVNFLEDHPISDLKKLDDYFVVQAVMNGCIAVLAEDFKKLKGFNPLYDKGFEFHDFCLRAKDFNIETHIVKASIIVNLDENRGWGSSSQATFYNEWSNRIKRFKYDLWGKAGFEVAGYKASDTVQGKLIPLLSVLDTKVNTENRKKSLRWAIKIAAPPDERRFAWGDVYFAQSLARALEQLGQTVSIDYLHAHDRPTTYLDDVVLAIRGLTQVRPHPGKYNVMWVISHPENISIEEINMYDKVYSAGAVWAQEISKKARKPVAFLPQCTDTDVFKPTKSIEKYKNTVLFVGNSRKVIRPIVHDAIAAGLDPSVYGADWEELIDRKYIKGIFIPNTELACAYSSAKVVLNDHWEDMRGWGFISNRIFDALASGASVISDDVAGIDEIFSKKVFIYRNVKDLQLLNTEGIDTMLPSKKERLDLVQHIRNEHTFKNRARQLLNDLQRFENDE